MPHSATLARLQVLAAAALFSTGGAAIKACGLTSWQVGSFRSGVAAVVLLLFLPGARRLGGWQVWLVASTYGSTLLLYALANKLTTAANTIFLQSTAPLYLLLLAPLLLHEPVRRRDVVFMALIGAGSAFFFVGEEVKTAVASDPFTGNILAILSGVGWALTILGLRWLGRHRKGQESRAAAAAAAGNIFACLVSLPLALPVHQAAASDWAWIAYLGAIQIGLAYAFLTTGIGRVPALEASLLLFLEPVLNPFWAWLLHRERPSAWALLGGVIILAATAARTLLEGRRAAAEAPRSNRPRPPDPGRMSAGPGSTRPSD